MANILEVTINDFICRTKKEVDDIISMANDQCDISKDKIEDIKKKFNINFNFNRKLTKENEDELIVIFKLLKKSGVRITIKNKDPFQYALDKKNLQLLKILTEADKDEALNIAIMKENYQIAQALIKEGANVTNAMLKEIRKYKDANYEIIEYMIDLGADASIVTMDDMTKLASCGKLSIVKLILEETSQKNSKELWKYFESLKPSN